MGGGGRQKQKQIDIDIETCLEVLSSGIAEIFLSPIPKQTS